MEPAAVEKANATITSALDQSTLPERARQDYGLLLGLALLGAIGGLNGCATANEDSMPWANRGSAAERWERESQPVGIPIIDFGRGRSKR